MIKTLHELREIRDQNKSKIELRLEGTPGDHARRDVLVCCGTACLSCDAAKVAKNFELILKARGYADKVQIIRTGCFGFCEQGPVVKIEPDRVFYVRVGPKDVKDIVDGHIIGGEVVERLLFADPENGEKLETHEKMPFYKKQLRVALRNCGLIDPEDIFEYIAAYGYEALGTALTNMAPEQVIDVIRRSGLRGRGGGGFPTGLKWEITRSHESSKKYIICNADEGDPGAFMDRSILEGDPGSIVEAMAIAGYAIGADEGLVYIRVEYPLAVSRLKVAIEQAREHGLLGENILGSGFSFDISLKYGAGAFVCGEETALINSCEGKRGEPDYKPPYPAEVGYKGKPTCVNNVETLANIPVILTKGAKWFSGIGTPESPGTKVFALAGKVNNVGLVEVPMGITLREIIFEIGGGVRNGRAFKAVQTGGPSGGMIPEKALDTPVDFESLLAIGSMMGSGGMIVLDDTDNAVKIAKFYLEFTMDESCGRCTPCRVGTKRMHELLEKITNGDADMSDIELLRELALTIKDSSLCGLGLTAPNPVLSSLENFYGEYLAFIKNQ